MRLWSRGAAINLGCAAAFAGWCWLWLWLCFEATVPYPGIFSMQGDRGAYEMPGLLGISVSRFFVAFYALAMLPPLLLGMARGWLDVGGEAARALGWSFGSGRLNAALAAVFLLMLGAVMLAGRGDSESLELVLVAIVLLGGAALPFFAWNRTTLSRSTPDRWWIPFWPGWSALAAVLALLALSTALGFAADMFSEIYGASVVNLTLQALAWLADLLIGLAMAVIWLDRGRASAVRADLCRVVRWPVLGAVLWQDLWLGLWMCAWAWPLLICAALAIYVVPQYEAMASAGGPPLSGVLGFVAGMGRPSSPMFFGMLIPATVYAWLAQGRLLVRRGIGA